ncbi:LOW QUALITY PROTEIN: nuclear body protein SP140-like protein [Camelus ferus]|uniref:LOW QUALITY PROTEIN: nuclear body protein SP140-like protein n=1 Tax=Camelus ferus TaxID=419612 RepID=A0A8B8SYZ3_CAMFR|nr:LOW QUALITY PROTEIN: nuclear body protein SP140-like protein [Camelus ferus]
MIKTLTKVENSNECEVCHGKGALFSCDTCSRIFHEKCHIQPKDAGRNPWSCNFCKIKALQERYSESQPCHQESEVLKRKMLPEEQLKCEFLLLKLYCSPKSPFFVSEPHYISKSNKTQNWHLSDLSPWLNRLKKKLRKYTYRQVEGFVQDMRLIFQNHRQYSSDKEKFIRLGLHLEARFENDFTDIFVIQEISTNSIQFEPHPIFFMT